MAKKGNIEEIFSRAQHADSPEKYKIFFRDFNKIRQLSLAEFILESDNCQTIPASRIQMIIKDNKTLFEKFKKE